MEARTFLSLAVTALCLSATCGRGADAAAPAPRSPATNPEAAARPLVGVYYFPGWYRGKADPTNQWSEWRRCIMKTPQPRALCGFYDDSEPRLWDYYTDWMSGHGINFVAFDWYYNDGEEALNDSLEKGYLGCTSRDKVQFALHWCNHPLGIWKQPFNQSHDRLLAMTRYLCRRYLREPNYLRIDGRPVFMVYDVDRLLSFGGFEAVQASLKAMRSLAREAGLGGLYLVAVYSRVSASYVQVCRDLGFDSFCAYTYVGTRYPPLRWDSQNIPYPTCVSNCVENIYPFLARIGREKGIVYWPTTFPGWDDRPRAGVERAFVTAGNTPELFGQMFRGALRWVSPSVPVVMVEAWNEWGEGACIEPDQQYRFGYLQQIASALGKTPPQPKVPTQREVDSWSVLTPEEVAAAKAIEGRPWQPKAPVYLEPGRNRQVPPAKLPLRIELRSGGAEVLTAGGNLERRDTNGLLFVSTSNDPQVYVRVPAIPITQIKRLSLYAEGAGDSGLVATMELFFLTALYPNSSAFCSAQLGPLRGTKLSVETSDIMGWNNFGTPLTSVRIDPGESPGTRVLLKSIVIE